MKDGIWIRRTDKKIEELYGRSNIADLIKAQRLRWFRYVERMSEAKLPKSVMRREIGVKKGKKNRGRDGGRK